MNSTNDNSGVSFVKNIRNWLVTGIIVVAPIVITIWILVKFFIIADNILGKPIHFFLTDILQIEWFIEHKIYGIGFFTLLIIIIALGWFARQYLGIRLVKMFNSVIDRIPLVNKVHTAIMQISEALLGGRKDVFQVPVLIQFPQKGQYSVGFVTQDTRGPIQKIINEDVISVFIPTTPNPTSGYLLFIPKNDVFFLDVSVEDALKLIISAGTVIPARSSSAREVAKAMGIQGKYDTPDKKDKSG